MFGIGNTRGFSLQMMEYLNEKRYDLSGNRNRDYNWIYLYEILGLSPLGIVVPDYIALFIE